MVRLVEIAPEDQTVVSLDVRTCDSEHTVNPVAGCYAQTDQIVEGLGQINLDFAAHTIAYDGERVGDGIGEHLAQQTRATGRLYTERVAQPIILGHSGILDQQILLCGRRWYHFKAVHRIFVGFQPDVLEQLGDAFARNWLTIFPIWRINDLLHSRQHNSIEIVGHIDQNEFTPPIILAVEVDDRMGSCARAGEEIKNCITGFFRRSTQQFLVEGH